MKKYVAVALIICGGMVISAYVVSKMYLRVRKEESIAVAPPCKQVVKRESFIPALKGRVFWHVVIIR